MVSRDFSVEESAKRESCCMLTAKDFYLVQMASTSGDSWTLFPLEVKEKPKKEWALPLIIFRKQGQNVSKAEFRVIYIMK